MKKTKGFTLVELVVVIAIIGVLASILVPTMLTYIRKAKLKAANTNAKTAYNAVAEFVTETNAKTGDSLPNIVSTYVGNTVIDCNIPPVSTLRPAQQAVHDVLAINGISSGHVWAALTQINNELALYVQWTGDIGAANLPDAVVGQYPDPVSWDTYRSSNNHFTNYIAPV